MVALALLGMLAGASETQQWKAAQSSAMQCNAVQVFTKDSKLSALVVASTLIVASPCVTLRTTLR